MIADYNIFTKKIKININLFENKQIEEDFMSRRKVQFLFNKFFEKREKFGIFCFLFGFFNGVFWIVSLLGCVVRQSGLREGY